jgi:hypothetical protein
MIKSLSRGGAVALAGSAVALVGAVLPAQAATNTGWRTAATVASTGRQAILTSIDAVSAADAWAAGFAATASGTKPVGLVEHWTGKRWQQVTLPATVAKAWAGKSADFPVVGAASSTNVWAFDQVPGATGSDHYLRLSGRRWTVGTLPGTNAGKGQFVILTSVEVLGKQGVWVFGGKLRFVAASGQPSLAPYAAHFIGNKWTSVKVAGSGEITSVSVLSPSNMWAVVGASGLGGELASSSTPAVLHWNGTSWQPAAVQPAVPAGADLTSVTAAAGNKVWVGGDVPTKYNGTVADFVTELTGTAWSAPVDLPGSGATAPASNRLPYELESIVPDGSGGLWALADNYNGAVPRLWHFSGGKWSHATSPGFGGKYRTLLQLAAVPGARGSVWAAGTVGVQARAKGLIAITGPTPR